MSGTDASRGAALRPHARRARVRVPLPLAAVLAPAAAFLALLVVSPAVRARTDDFLQLFRTGRREPLAIVDASLPPIPGVDTAALAGAITMQWPPGQEVAMPHDAQDRVDFNVRTLRRERAPRIHVFVNDIATIRIDRAKAEQTLTAAAGPGLRLPRELDQPVQARISAGVRFVWDEPGGRLTLWLLRNPRPFTTTGPPWEEQRARLIQIYQFLNPQAASRLLAVRDWDNTVVVPVPPDAASRRVRVDGADNGLLIERGGRATVVWQRYGVVHVLDGAMSGRALIRLANQIR